MIAPDHKTGFELMLSIFLHWSGRVINLGNYCVAVAGKKVLVCML